MSKKKTLENLMEAFAGESQANRRYLAYAKQAEAEGRSNAAKLFRAASDAEAIHAQSHLRVAGEVGTTQDNLNDAMQGETHEFEDMYPDFVEEAQKDGDSAAVRTFTHAMKAEEVHAKRYQQALENIDETQEVFYYLCPVCGNIETAVPRVCFICMTPGDKFIKY